MIWRREKSVMRKSDTTTIVIAFPGQQPKHLSATEVHPQKVVPRTFKRWQTKSLSKLRTPLHADTPRDVLQQHRRQIEILTTKGNPTPELIDKLAPGLVRNVLRRAGAVDCAKANLPKPLMRRLDLMCQFKHPAALIIQGWLDGKRAFLPTNLQTIADFSTCCEEEK
tara:strand:- start:4053 stop:4553 length:501 start_codon:yes stop_codon:yes gene_type:complete